MKEKLTGEITGLFVGKVENHWFDRPATAIAKNAPKNRYI